MGEIRQAFQAPGLVGAVQTNYWLPNGFVSISDRLASAGVNTLVDQQVPVSEFIRGTQIVGQAQFTARINLSFIPDSQRAVGLIRLTGNADSDNTAIRKKVRVYSVGTTCFQASKAIYISPEGLTSSPAQADADTQSQITGVSHWLGLIRRIAGRVAEKARPEGEQIASQKVAKQVAQQMDDQAVPLLKKANDQLDGPVETLLRNWDVYPRWLALNTTHQDLRLGALHVTPLHLAANTRPPAVTGRFDLLARVHESLAANVSASVLGGKKLTGERIVELLNEFELEIPAELKDPEEDPFSITFRDTGPVTAEFHDGTLRLAIRAKEFKGFSGANEPVEVRRNLQVWAEYSFRLNPDGSATLTRLGEVDAEFDDIDRAVLDRTKQLTILAVLKKKGRALFKESIEVPTFALPSPWDVAGDLRLRLADSNHGWLTLGWVQTIAEPYKVAAGDALQVK